MVKDFQDLQLPVLVLFVLVYFLDGDLFPASPYMADVHCSEGSLARHSVHFVPVVLH